MTDLAGAMERARACLAAMDALDDQRLYEPLAPDDLRALLAELERLRMRCAGLESKHWGSAGADRALPLPPSSKEKDRG